MQSRNGGYAAFDTDNTNAVWNEIPFADMKAMIDPPTEDVTGPRARADGHGRLRPRLRPREARARVRPQHAASPTGAGGAAGASTSSTARGRCSPGLRSIGEDMQAPHVRQAVDWLAARQNADGGLAARPIASYDDESLAGCGESTPSQTAWAVMGLLAGDGPRGVIERGIEWLLQTQNADGTWEEKPWTGTRLPAPLLPPLPHVPALLPADGARPVSRAISWEAVVTCRDRGIRRTFRNLALPLPALARRAASRRRR